MSTPNLCDGISLFKAWVLVYGELSESSGCGGETGHGGHIRREDPGAAKEGRLTLDLLAEMTGSSKSYIWEIENKNPPRPSAEKIDRSRRR